MATEDHTKQCSPMTDQELVATLTIERDKYSAQFHLAAQAEINRRGLRLSEFKNHVGIRISSEGERIGTIKEALQELDKGVCEYDILRFTNCVGQSLIFQRDTNSLLGHYINRGEYVHSFTIRPSQRPVDILKTFLNLQDWTSKIEETFNLHQWEFLIDSNSGDDIKIVSQLLARRNIPSCSMNTRFSPFSSEQGDSDSKPFKILVPKEALDSARKVVQEIEARIKDLYRQASELARGEDRLKELDVLSELATLVCGDERVHYRRGIILQELGRYQEAADSFIASLANNSGHEQLFNDAYQSLELMATRLPDDVHVLHNLATFSVTYTKDPKSVEKYYQKILAIQPQDAVAHLQLGHLYYELDDDISAYRHFKTYLELEPESEEREAIEQILGQLRSITTTEDDISANGTKV